ncbi:hypothetical protein BC938DRAFT_470673 [Jimgerdemannia flammicorona]|uniref:Protein kinase domain-containing protein n=1 Tax=Jimgerdemannia flammicorona TaxID=994334 RepID=A0A433R035_9FUNG|nr:hypothetical protein BC938DRAFT_470673 [Jimgerdemannia flammicorona]
MSAFDRVPFIVSLIFPLAAIDENRIDLFPLNEFNKPVFIAQGRSGAIYRVTSIKRKKQYALKYLNILQILRKVDDEDFVARCYGVSRGMDWRLISFFSSQGSYNFTP